MDATELGFTPAAELIGLIRSHALTTTEVVDAFLDRIDRLNPTFNLFCLTCADEARRQAVAADEHAGREPARALEGVPYALKDFTPTRGLRTTRGSYAFEQWIPDEDPPIVERLRDAGGILLGKTTTSELAHSSFTRSRLWGVSRNPWNAERTPGGSSGGSAGAVAAGLVPIAEGSDAGGSVRIPASCCGVFGFKPAHGRVPMHATPNDFEQVFHFGPITRTVSDAILMLEAIEGPDDRDPMTVVPGLPRPIQAVDRLDGLRAAVTVDLGYYRVHDDVARNTEHAAEALRELGMQVEPVELDWDQSLNEAWATNWSVLLATLYGESLDRVADRVDPELLLLVDRGRSLSAVALKQVDLVRTRLWASLRRIFDHFDVLVCPTLAVLVPPAEGVEDSDYESSTSDGRFAGLEMTSPFSLVPQCPVASVPSGFDRDGLPTGMQIVGRRFDDVTVLGVAAGFERIRPWTQHRPLGAC
jgi:Asp-tRNA(Asn)/Glu-tRNA(Gln) amidotransferase A subunit family amidase